ncbi:putative phosphoglycerate mutase family protein [Botrytis fragariae]|uniref:Putative phosphoglycerate mutase family protein n=1 Tax=Botrytis fragariae TaxID=1964551 RepID=A0A8H6EJL2_9HELO|nr:putative phosphoglycerate mutase family protein [Botrytis fragariae]KAF5874683.1 putative phosphoglycerate mutase family protein [Botrytis fragariae]
MNSNTPTELSHVDGSLSRWMPPRLSTLLTDDLEGHATPPREGRVDRLVIFHFMRHGQAYSNVGELDNRGQLRDPKLTFDGIRQCELVRAVLNSNCNIKQIYCSPMIRAIETALTTFRDVIRGSSEKPAIQTTAWDALREWGSIPCCTGTPIAKLQEKFGHEVDFSLIKPGWEFNKEKYGDKSRAAQVKQSLFKIARNVQELTRRGLISDIRDGDFSTRGRYYVPYEIAIVSHGGFLETMLDAELGGKASQFPYRNCFHNANLKSFSFETINGPGGVRYELTETRESKTRKYSRGPIPLS